MHAGATRVTARLADTATLCADPPVRKVNAADLGNRACELIGTRAEARYEGEAGVLLRGDWRVSERAMRSAAWLGVGVVALVVHAMLSPVTGQTPAAKPEPNAKVAPKPAAKTDKRATGPKAATGAPPAAAADSPPAVAADPAPAATGEAPADPVVKAAEPAPPAAAAEPPAVAAAPAIPSPAPSTPEAEYFAKLDALIAPVRDYSPSSEDLQRVRELVTKAGMTSPQMHDTWIQIKDPAARKLVEWQLLKAGLGAPKAFVDFIEQSPSWPDRAELQRRAEEQLLEAGGSTARIAAFFKGGEPRSGAGLAALASAHLAEKNEEAAKKLAVKVWREFELPAALEAGFLERFGSWLTEADHKRRLDRILVDEVRFKAERDQRAELAKRVIRHLSEPEKKKAEARLAVFLRAKLAGQMLAALPAEPDGQPASQTDWGLAYQKVQHYRRGGQHEEAWKILTAAPTDPELITSPDDWWAERRGAAYDALKAGRAELAYDLVKDAGPLSVNPLKDQSFMAGWLALRHLGKPEAARGHFDVSQKAADGPLSKARAEYWLGRALDELGRKDEARQRYAAAALQTDAFHGLLGRHKLEAGDALDLRTGLPALPTPEDAARFVGLDSVRAAVIAIKAGLSPSVHRALFAGLRNHLDGEADLAMLAHLASALGDPQASLRIGKTAIAKGRNLIVYAYPLHTFPAYTPLRDPPEPALLLGIARQESEFNNQITSTAGARGLLQVMPVTAQHICRDYKIKCDIARLNSDNAYNAMLASAYVTDRMRELSGNYVLTLVAYNAGPGRARQWMREFGDPRDPAIDAIDWIERIPIEETREYVKKVLANVQVYRARLGDERALRLEADLRGKSQQRRTSVP